MVYEYVICHALHSRLGGSKISASQRFLSRLGEVGEVLVWPSLLMSSHHRTARRIDLAWLHLMLSNSLLRYWYLARYRYQSGARQGQACI